MKNKKTILTIIFVLLLAPNFMADAIFALIPGEPESLKATEGKDLSDYMYLREEREKLTYSGLPHILEGGTSLLRIGEIDRVIGTVELEFWFWVTKIPEDDPWDFTEKNQSSISQMLDHWS